VNRVQTVDSVFGVKAEDAVNITIRDSFSAGNGYSGYAAITTSYIPTMLIESSATINNGAYGVRDSGSLSVIPTVVRLSHVTITGNSTGIGKTGNATIISFGNNSIHGNATDGTPDLTIGQQ
jgi:hypothetical protein